MLKELPLFCVARPSRWLRAIDSIKKTVLLQQNNLDMTDWRNHIHSDPATLLGKPVIKGTRISVELILELFAEGWTTEQILESYAGLKEADLKATFLYLKECIGQELFFPIKQVN